VLIKKLLERLEAMEQKPWYLSKTIWGIVVMGLGVVAPKLVASYGSPDVLTNQIVTAVSGVADLIGFVLAIYGRFKATKTIGTVPSTDTSVR
jgi:hypothetical protein